MFTVGDLGHCEDVDGEVERHLLDHPDVAEAVVYGVPDEDWAERLVAELPRTPNGKIRRVGLADALESR